ncbi:RNA-directed DNA polymerase from mobile element jockey-like protein [Pitangus sulphuratus]|nr:RNA-directed DNA polymerase from mobile element jockey-like protein [Pitangus sulphuratus]
MMAKGVLCPELENHGCDKLSADLKLVQDLLLQLDPCKYMGLDGINPRILKELGDAIARPLTMIFEWPWESGEVPADWKLANIVPVFQKGDPGNYRPAILTSVTGKMRQKIILRGIEKHLKDNTVIGYSQHSFVRGNFCLSNLISFFNEVTHLADQGERDDVIFLDFHKALDTASHRILLVKCPT